MDHNPRSDLRGLLRSGLSKSLVSLGIKVATAGLTYVMYVILSRLMGIEEYGYFAFGLSLATILAIGANYGQQTAILRVLGRSLHSTYGPTADTGGLAQTGGTTIYAYPDLAALIDAESRGASTKTPLRALADIPVTERPGSVGSS